MGIGGGSFGKVIGVILLVVALPIFAGMGILSAETVPIMTRLHNCIGWNHINAINRCPVHATVRHRRSIQLPCGIRLATWLGC
jgi:hypothetical protein